MTQNLPYTKALELLATDDLDWANSNGWKCMLLDNTYVYDAAHDFVTDVSASQVVGTGYTAGGQALTGMTRNYVAPYRVFDCDDPAWPTSTLTAQFAVFYKDTGTPATSPLLMAIDAEGDVSSLATTFTVPINSNGLARLGFVSP